VLPLPQLPMDIVLQCLFIVYVDYFLVTFNHSVYLENLESIIYFVMIGFITK
jgi:hypothetical protein